MQACLQEDFELGTRQNMSKKPFLKKNERITNVLGLRECKARSNPVSEGTNTAAMGIILVAACFNKVHLQIWSATACANTALARYRTESSMQKRPLWCGYSFPSSEGMELYRNA